MEGYEIYMWEPSVSPHKIWLFRALREEPAVKKISYIAHEDVPATRRAQGWSVVLEDFEAIIAPSPSDVECIVRQSSHNAIHIFSGMRHVPTLLRGIRACRKHKRYFAFMQEPRVFEGVKGILRLLQSWVSEGAYRRNASFILAQGRHGPGWFKIAGYSVEKIFPFAYFLRETKILPSVEVANTGRRIAYIGRLDTTKGVDAILLAREFLDAEDTISFVGDGDLRANIIEASANYPEQIFYRGVLPNELIPEFLSQIDVLVLASRSMDDGWGAVISEALLCGVAVVCSDRVGASICVQANWRLGVVIEQVCPEAISRAIKDLSNRSALTQEARTWRRHWAIEVLSSTAGAKHLLKLLDHVYLGAERPIPYYATRGIDRMTRFPKPDVTFTLAPKRAKPVLAMVWDNYGPLHHDRLKACHEAFYNADVVGIEITSSSDTYSWIASARDSFRKLTLFRDRNFSETSDFAMAWAAFFSLLRIRATHVFLCHYQRIGTFALAIALRLLGRRVYVMGCPKFDDRPRNARKEFLKQVFLAPYHGALVGSSPTKAYFEFLGFERRRIALGYNSVSIDRLRAGTDQRTPVPTYNDRHFTIVARLVKKKNIGLALEAFSLYRAKNHACDRILRIFGDGPMDVELRGQADLLGITPYVSWEGFQQSEQISQALHSSVALILPSTEEQFGNVVPEALALGVPLLTSDVCGARYDLLRSAVNGFMFESDNPNGLAYYMALLGGDEELWANLHRGALLYAHRGDVAEFVRGIEALVA